VKSLSLATQSLGTSKSRSQARLQVAALLREPYTVSYAPDPVDIETRRIAPETTITIGRQ
jgi:hypothetical protein